VIVIAEPIYSRLSNWRNVTFTACSRGVLPLVSSQDCAGIRVAGQQEWLRRAGIR
jgi:hypothetical protein